VGTGGLVQTVALMNSIIFATTICIIVSIIAVGSSRPITNQEEELTASL
jgi:hypothetical protein